MRCKYMEGIKRTKNSLAIDKLYDESSNFIVIGLTGRTGSGCSTSAQILSQDKIDLPETDKAHYTDNEARKYRIVKKYINESWEPFDWLQVRAVITRYILILNFNELARLISNVMCMPLNEVISGLEEHKSEYVEKHELVKKYINLSEETREEIDHKMVEAYELYFNILPEYSDRFRNALKGIRQDVYVRLYQAVGDNIRASGKAHARKFNQNKVFDLVKTINKIIKSVHYVHSLNNRSCRVVVDAIRNPLEAVYFQERYANFFLVSVNTSNENRIDHLRSSHSFTDSQITELDEKEYPSNLKGYMRFVSQDIQRCIEFSDIHINNPKTSHKKKSSELKCQLAWYVSLMLHPGLVSPTATERCMQFACSAKLNSGCISRQVGAVVTDDNYSVKAVGWNNSPHGQVPCVLRNAEDLLNGYDEIAYSNYENNDADFREAISVKFQPVIDLDESMGRNISYCFKDLKNEMDGEKNQVHTRSLHAEENAFLQITKYGGQKVDGGFLFTTASPCELCSKKAYQIGIKKVVYIDPYPGIANDHILGVGENRPELELFRGAVGRAYHHLFRQVMPYKDEVSILFDIRKTKDSKTQKIRELTKCNNALLEQNKNLKAEIDNLKG